jgi:hypothetical protein
MDSAHRTPRLQRECCSDTANAVINPRPPKWNEIEIGDRLMKDPARSRVAHEAGAWR